jgi:hypothetical protein
MACMRTEFSTRRGLQATVCRRDSEADRGIRDSQNTDTWYKRQRNGKEQQGPSTAQYKYRTYRGIELMCYVSRDSAGRTPGTHTLHRLSVDERRRLGLRPVRHQRARWRRVRDGKVHSRRRCTGIGADTRSRQRGVHCDRKVLAGKDSRV